MKHSEISIGNATYELERVYTETVGKEDLLVEQLVNIRIYRKPSYPFDERHTGAV